MSQTGAAVLDSDAKAFLASFSVFEDYKKSPHALDNFFTFLKERHFAAGDQILKEGEMGSEMYFLISGRVGVFKVTPSGDEFIVAELGSEQRVIFGEGALIDIDKRSATIKAKTPCRTLYLERRVFDEFCDKQPEIALPFFKRIARLVMTRFRKTNQDFMLLYNALVEEIHGETR